MKWAATHPIYPGKECKGVDFWGSAIEECTSYEWAVTPVDIIGELEDSNLCKGSVTSTGGWQVKLSPLPIYTEQRTLYPQPFLEYLAAVGGIITLLMTGFGVIITVLRVGHCIGTQPQQASVGGISAKV
jgi:hypothetical protein